MKLVVVADDLTGAAELAGAAWARGLSACVARRSPWPEGCDVLCVDTDTRDLPADEAGRIVGDVARALGRPVGVRFYKKVDSVLRGPVLAELEAMRQALGRPCVLLLPANPSRGRVIRDGHYFIQDVPLDRTEFARDPRHPRASSDVCRLLGPQEGVNVVVRRPGQSLPEKGIVVADAGSEADVEAWAGLWTETLLAAGGVDFFRALLDRWAAEEGKRPARHGSAGTSRVCEERTGSGAASGLRILMVSGTASPQARAWREASERAGIPVVGLFDGGGSVGGGVGPGWEGKVAMCASALARVGRMILFLGAIAAPGAPGSGPAGWVESLARAAGLVWGRSKPDLLLLEGGATAAAVLDGFPWGAWRAVREWAPGVVELRGLETDRPAVIVKPGSYPWPESIRELWFVGRRL